MSTHFTFQAIGTTWDIDIPLSLDPSREKNLLSAIKKRIDEFDRTYSRFREDSLVSLMAKKAGEYILPEDALLMMTLYREMYEATDGLMTPLVGQVLVDAGYDAAYSLQPKSEIKSAKNWDDVMSYEHPVLIIKEPVLLDFGAIGKGYLIDIVAAIIRDHGIKSYTINAGGDIAYKSEADKALRIGLEDPKDVKKAVGVANILDMSMCGSAGNRRVWDRFHHIINPLTVESPKHILGLWTVAGSTALADALSTALFFMKPEDVEKKLKTKYHFEYAIVYADGSARVSKSFPGNFFGAEEV